MTIPPSPPVLRARHFRSGTGIQSPASPWNCVGVARLTAQLLARTNNLRLAGDCAYVNTIRCGRRGPTRPPDYLCAKIFEERCGTATIHVLQRISTRAEKPLLENDGRPRGFTRGDSERLLVIDSRSGIFHLFACANMPAGPSNRLDVKTIRWWFSCRQEILLPEKKLRQTVHRRSGRIRFSARSSTRVKNLNLVCPPVQGWS